MVAVVDYGAGNLRSVKNALQGIGADFVVTSDEALIRAADHVLLPGVGEAASAMAALRRSGLDKVIPTLTAPVLGICIGMQLMCEGSEEGNVDCLGIFRTRVTRFRPEDSSADEKIKIPHMGWNSVRRISSESEGEYVYYVHSYAPELCEDTAAVTTYGSRTFSAALSRGNFHGTQFHPEKSGAAGERILRSFLAL